jgi:16S rRNA (cytosine967-C5)-methyltransferase
VQALRVLVRVETDRAFADIALEHALSVARLPTRDAALCTEIVYGTLRWQRHLDWRLGPHLHRPLARLDPWVRALLRLTAYQVLMLDRVPGWAAVDQAVSLARLKSREPGPARFVNAVLRALTAAPAAPPLPADPVEAAAIRWSFPDWLARRWADRLGRGDAERLMEACNQRPPLTLRANLLRGSREDLIRRLREREGIEARPTPLAPEGVVAGEGIPARWAVFAEGRCTVQDEASMLVARLLGPEPGERVADACAAPGTKTTHLAELMGDRGTVLAIDTQPARLALAGRAAARLGLGIVECHPGSVIELAPRWRERCDRVLVDAPCSNLGVLRRNPEVKWRRGPEDLARLPRRQRAILEAAAQMARPGGRLVYATCSLEPEENEAVVDGFLAAHPAWQVEPPPVDFPLPPDARGFVRLDPVRHGTDGFTALRLRRAG